MKRVLFIGCLGLVAGLGLSLCSAAADVGSLQASAGVVVPYDVSAGDSAVGGHISYAIGVTDHAEIGGMFMKSGYLDAQNDITDGDVELSVLMIQGRWIVNPAHKTRGFVDLGAGMMDVDARGPSAISNRAGGAVRLGIGVDRDIARAFSVRFSTGYTTGVGRTGEIDLLDLSVSLMFGVPLLQEEGR